MLEETGVSKERYQRFLKRVWETREVWTIDNGRGVANVPSNHEETEGTPVLLFWSERAYAGRCAVDEWAAYKPQSIPLDLFMERWLPGMTADGVLAGAEWNARLIGVEVPPADLQVDLRNAQPK